MRVTQPSLFFEQARSWVTGISIAVLGFGISISRSISDGRAGAELTFDDVSYINSGLQAARSIRQTGLVQVIPDLLQSPPHAPVLHLIATMASLLGEPSAQRVYFSNAVFLTFLTLVAVRLASGARWSYCLAITGFFLASPWGFFSFDQFRPDPAYAIGIAILSSSFVRYCLRSGSLAQCSTAFLLLLFLKPSVFPMTLVISGSLVVLSVPFVLGRLLAETRTRDVQLSICVLFFGLMTFSVYGLRMFIYSWSNTRGDLGYIWQEPSPWSAIHRSFDEGLATVGWPLWIVLGSLPILTPMAIRTNRRESVIRITLYLGATISLLPLLAWTRVGGVFFGIMLLSPMTALAIGLMVEPFSRLRKHAIYRLYLKLLSNVGAMTLICVSVLLLFAYLIPPVRWTPPGLFEPRRVNTRVFEAILTDCRDDPVCDGDFLNKGQLPPIFATGIAEISASSLTWEAMSRGWNVNVQGVSLTQALEDITTSIPRYQYVVVTGPTARYVNPRYPVTNLQDEVAQLLETKFRWYRVDVPSLGTEYFVYRKTL